MYVGFIMFWCDSVVICLIDIVSYYIIRGGFCLID